MSVALFSLFSAGALFVVVGLYLRRNRPRTLVVPFSPIFEGGKKEGRLARLAPRLLHPLTLLLQLAIVVLFLYFARPPGSARASAKSHVVLLDVSEEMGRRDESGTTALGLALLGVSDFVGSLPETDVVHVVALSASPHVLWSGPGGSEVSRQLAPSIEFGVPDLEEALTLARGLGDKEERIHLASPRRAASLMTLGDSEVKALRLLPIDFPSVDPKRELSLQAFGARRYPGDPGCFEALLRIAHGSGAKRPVEVVFSNVDDKGRRTPFFSGSRTLGEQESEELRFPNLDAGRGALVATIRALDRVSDGLTSDEIAFATIEERVLLAVEVQGPRSTFLEAALSLDPFLRAARPGEVPSAAVVTAGKDYPSDLERPTLLFGAPPKEGKLLSSKRALENFGLDNWQEHPLFADVDPYDIQILRGASFVLERGDRSLADSSGAPVIVQGTRGGIGFLAVGFRPEESDFVLRAAYPIFLHNALRFLADQKSSLPRGFEVNRPAKVKFDGVLDADVRIEGPLGDESEVWSGRLRAGALDLAVSRPGIYSLSAADKRQLVAFRRPSLVAPNSDKPTPLESSPKARASGDVPRPFFLLSLALFALLLFEGWGYHRRVTA